jgi:YD repeat-containing protein
METDALNNDTTYSYNKLNQVISKIDGENNRVDYTYDYS